MRRPALPARIHLGLSLMVALLPVSCGGCERRVEEPAPVREVHPLTSLPASAPAPSEKPAAAPKRCVRASPKLAARPLPKSPDPACPKDPEKPPPVRTGKVTFEGAATAAAPLAVTVEVVQNDHDRQRGLMYRTRMPADHGMIFVFDEKSNHAFWMHNTCIPLDMLYIDDDGLIVGIEENTPTMSDDTFEVGCDSKYVLEMNASWTRSHGVMAGQRVRLDGI